MITIHICKKGQAPLLAYRFTNVKIKQRFDTAKSLLLKLC